jgi:SAM-dependent methyltransferase
MYDYYLGGHHNFQIDRQVGEQAIALWPDLPLIMRANRAFLRRAVNYIVAQGVTQFLDIGSGIPTVGNVHEVAQRADPTARVVYVDIDPIAVAHSEFILRGTSNVSVLRGDVRDPEAILAHPEVERLLDFRQPLAVLLVALLHFTTDNVEASAAVQTLRDALAPGSFLVISHASPEGMPQESREHEELYRRTPTPLRMRTRREIERFFGDFELIEPGLVFLPLWRPEGRDDVFLDQPERCTGFAAVGRKPWPPETPAAPGPPGGVNGGANLA